MKKIIIMDFSTSEIHVFDYPEGRIPEELLTEHYSEDGQTFKESHCNWMVIDLSENEGRLPIYIH